MVLFAIGVMQVVFDVPFHGGLLLILGGAALCILCGISIGTVIATFSKSAEQAQLTSFFVNPPLSTLSGAFYPIEGMPRILQRLTIFQSGLSLRGHRSRGVAQGQRICGALAQFSGADCYSRSFWWS